MGAVQAQDYAGSLWAVGVRLAGAAEADVEAALVQRTIVRTWPMRGTLHLVPAADARWMLRRLAPRAIARAAGRHRELDLTAAAFRKSERVLVRALEGGRALTRREAYEALERAGVAAAGQRGIHILGHLAQRGVLCLGARRDRQPTFVLLDDWVPPAKAGSDEEALAELAIRYFASHGPATVRDFAWWSDLLRNDAERAIADAGAALASSLRDGVRHWSATTGTPAPGPSSAAVLLPPWDEYVVAYKDRGHALAPRSVAGRRYAVGLPLVVVDGLVIGSWRRTLTASIVRVQCDYWTPPSRPTRRAVDAAARRYAAFLGRVIAP
jgi:hypothetical protein